MLRTNMKFVFRNLAKRKLFSFINVVGLAIGVGAALVILKYMDFETSYDSFHVNKENLYRVTRSGYRDNNRFLYTTTVTASLAPTIAAQVPEVKSVIRVHPMWGGAVLAYRPLNGDAKMFHEDHIQVVDPEFLRAFTFEGVRGDVATALDQPSSIVITESMASKYFGKEDPLGKMITVTGASWSNGDYNVSCVIKDVPGNSHFDFDVLLPMHNLLQEDQYKGEEGGWGTNNFFTYVQLHPTASADKARLKLADVAKYVDIQRKTVGSYTELDIQPITDIHLTPGIRHDTSSISESKIYFFGLTAFFIVAIAWVNYINLSTARATERAREVGIKKSIGAYKSQLVAQFFLESMVINLLGVVLAVLIAVLLLPLLGDMIGKQLAFDFTDVRLWGVLVSVFAFGTIAAGAYPSFVLSSFSITEVIKGSKYSGNTSLRKGLVVFQFAASIILIAGTFVVYRQISFMQNESKGLNMDQVLIVSGPSTLNDKEAKQRLALFKEQLRTVPGVTAVATSGAIPGGGHNWSTGARKAGTTEGEAREVRVVLADHDFVDTYGIQLISGRNFDESDDFHDRVVIINEATVDMLGLANAEQALYEKLIIGDDTVSVRGVVKNYNWNSLRNEITPFILYADDISTTAVSIHLEGSIHSAVQQVESIYRQLVPGDPFEYYFLDDFFNKQYKSDKEFGEVFALFAMLAVAISCLGLWGLASFMTIQRMKEIGVRKVLGATAGSIVYLLSSQFMKLVLVASLIALPLAWYGMESWLGGFAYRVGLNWELFVVPVALLGTIAFVTVSAQVLKGAMSNPVKALRE